MFDISWTEFLLIGVVALIAIGPKELPGVLRTAGQWMGKVRRMAADFQGQFNEVIREADMADLKKEVDALRNTASGFTSGITSHVTDAMNLDDPPRPASSEPPAEAISGAPPPPLVEGPHGDGVTPPAPPHVESQALPPAETSVPPAAAAAPPAAHLDLPMPEAPPPLTEKDFAPAPPVASPAPPSPPVATSAPAAVAAPAPPASAPAPGMPAAPTAPSPALAAVAPASTPASAPAPAPSAAKVGEGGA